MPLFFGAISLQHCCNSGLLFSQMDWSLGGRDGTGCWSFLYTNSCKTWREVINDSSGVIFYKMGGRNKKRLSSKILKQGPWCLRLLVLTKAFLQLFFVCFVLLQRTGKGFSAVVFWVETLLKATGNHMSYSGTVALTSCQISCTQALFYCGHLEINGWLCRSHSQFTPRPEQPTCWFIETRVSFLAMMMDLISLYSRAAIK